ncbi:dihydropteroate synthase [Actinoalloteichus hoggarensis]|nr:dihydropteroate synthase [Actinoalloteichus hoggarensis]
MGVLNVTPDSFSDGGRYLDRDAAVAHGVEMFQAGADLVDVGGESTRPGSDRVPAEVERDRVVPVIAELASAGVPVSIDTTRSAVAAAAVAAGAILVNDVSGGLADERMAAVVADLDVPWVLMHWRGHSRRMQELAVYDDVVAEVCRELSDRVDAALAAGVAESALVLDPGLGFAKTGAHNWRLLGGLDDLRALGPPILIGASRKRFLGTLLADDSGRPRPADGREVAGAVVAALSARAGAWGVRVHDVVNSLDAVKVVAAWNEGSSE